MCVTQQLSNDIAFTGKSLLKIDGFDGVDSCSNGMNTLPHSEAVTSVVHFGADTCTGLVNPGFVPLKRNHAVISNVAVCCTDMHRTEKSSLFHSSCLEEISPIYILAPCFKPTRSRNPVHRHHWSITC